MTFLSQAKDLGRFLNSFTPPEGYRPPESVPALTLSPEMARDLGAGSLKDFFALALEGEEGPPFPGRGGGPAFFPRGPESIRAALTAVEAEYGRLAKEIDQLERTWPSRQPGFDAAVRPRENTLAALGESRANLVRAARLWPRMKAEAAVWPKEARFLWQKAQRLQEVVNRLLKAVRDGGDADELSQRSSGRRSLTRVTVELKAEVNSARAILTGEARWIENMEAFSADLDDVLAVVVDGSRADRDWNADSRRLSALLADLERDDRHLKDETARTAEALQRSLGLLSDIESRLSGRENVENLDRLDHVGRGVEALWRSTVERRRDLARIYFALPARLGRPVFLEKVFLATAQALGRTQSLLEDLRHRLSLAGGRLSTTHRLRSEGESLKERLGQAQPRGPRLKAARKRLGVLAGVVDQRLSLKETKGELEEALVRGREAERELTRGRAENGRMLQELRASAVEKERLSAQLAASRQGLGDVGRVKARLLKVYESKSALLSEVEEARQRLSLENEALRGERSELRRKRSQLAELYARERGDLKKLTAELRVNRGELAKTQQFVAERRDLEVRLDETRREREALDVRRREVETRLQEQSQRLAAAVARVESLSAELSRHREELAEASRVRVSMGDMAAALRRKLDLVSQAHSSLLNTLNRRERTLNRSEADRREMTGRLTRQKRNLLRLVAMRQELRAELGTARLKMADLETEREAIFSRLAEARARALEADRDKREMAAQAAGLAEEKEALAVRAAGLTEEKEALAARAADLTEEKEALAARAADLTEEKEALATRAAGLTEENQALVEEKEALAARAADLTEEKEALAARAADLTEEKEALAARAADLTDENQTLIARSADLVEEKQVLISLAAELAEEKKNLTDRLATVAEEKSELAARLEALSAENGGLADRRTGLEEEKACLAVKLSGLEDEKNRLAFLLKDLEQRNDQLVDRQAELETLVGGELAPFIKILGEALWRSEAQLKRTRNAADRQAEQFKLGTEVREANLRLKAAGREIEFVEKARSERDQLEAALAVKKAELDLSAETVRTLEAAQAGWADERGHLTRHNRELSEAVTRLDGRTRKLRQALGSLKRRYGRRLEESRLTEEGLRGLLDRRGRELEDQKSRLAELEPLVVHFFEVAARDAAADAREGAETNLEVARYLQDESRVLKAELAGAEGVEGSPADLGEARPAEAVGDPELQARLAELEPLVAFLARSFVTGVAELAQAREERSVLAEDLARAREADSDLAGSLEQAREAHFTLAGELAQTRQERAALSGELDRAREERSNLAGELAQARQDRSALAGELSLTRSTRDILENSLASRESELSGAHDQITTLTRERDQLKGTRDILENSLASREAELLEVRDQAFALTRERDQLRGALAEKADEVASREADLSAARDQAAALARERDQAQEQVAEKVGEIVVLKSELAQADRDLEENDGRLEAAWAAMNYLGTRAGDTLAGMKHKLEDQTRQVDHLSLELKKRDGRIKTLEDRQDKLALLYWTLVAQAKAEPGLAPALPAEQFREALSEEAPVPVVAGPAGPLARDDARNSGGYSLGRGLLEGVKKVARRSLFTLIMAGGLVMVGSQPMTAAPSGVSPTPGWSAAGETPAHLLSRLDSTYIGRTVSLEIVETEARLAGRPAVESRLSQLVTDLAAAQGLSSGEFLRLVRIARGPEHTVHLDDFAGREGCLALLVPHFPKLTRHLSAWPPEILAPGQLTALMKSAADFKSAEGGFWERLFFDFLAAQKPGPALEALLERLGQKPRLAGPIRPEYAGRLAPFPPLENLGPDRFITFMSNYINTNWPSLSGRGRQQAARRLAGDLYFSARLFKLPITLLAVLTQEEAEAEGFDFFRRGGTSALYDRTADLADLARDFTLTWQEGRPPLCDLDEALASCEDEAFVEAVYRRKMALVMAYNKALNAGNTLLAELED